MVEPASIHRGPHLGVVDWGIGGLGLVGLVDERLPDLPVTYWSDAGATPYGLLPRAELAKRVGGVVAALAERGCTEVVLACNAASTVVGDLRSPVPVEGIIGHGIAAVPADHGGVVGVVAGARTIRSGAYRRGLTRPGREVRSRIAQPLSAHIEAGRTGSDGFVADLRSIVRPLLGARSVVLACTHYPAASQWFAKELPGTELLDPAEELAGALVRRHGSASGDGGRTFLTTGDPGAMASGASAAWGADLPEVRRVRL